METARRRSVVVLRLDTTCRRDCIGGNTGYRGLTFGNRSVAAVRGALGWIRQVLLTFSLIA